MAEYGAVNENFAASINVIYFSARNGTGRTLALY